MAGRDSLSSIELQDWIRSRRYRTERTFLFRDVGGAVRGSCGSLDGLSLDVSSVAGALWSFRVSGYRTGFRFIAEAAFRRLSAVLSIASATYRIPGAASMGRGRNLRLQSDISETL
jgi:hypothetical protein